MKRFRWGDVMPRPGVQCAGPDDERPEPDGLHALAVHGLAPVDPRDVGVVHLPRLVSD